MKKVTFAIPAYNHENYIKETLDSIWEDDYPCREIVIINDGSSDGTAEVIKNWCDSKGWVNIVFISWPNRGITATLNKLIEMSSGDYIRLFSSDDLLSFGSTRELIDILEDDENTLAVFGDAAVIDKDGALIHASALISNGGDKRKLLDNKLLTEEIVSNWAVSGPVILIKKCFFENHGAYDEAMLVDDWDVYTRLVATGGLRFVDSCVAKYRIHGENTSKTRVINKRIMNLLSQASVVDRNINLFRDVRIRSLFLAEKYLLLTKATYLSFGIHRCGLNFLKYIAYKLVANMRVKF